MPTKFRKGGTFRSYGRYAQPVRDIGTIEEVFQNLARQTATGLTIHDLYLGKDGLIHVISAEARRRRGKVHLDPFVPTASQLMERARAKLLDEERLAALPAAPASSIAAKSADRALSLRTRLLDDVRALHAEDERKLSELVAEERRVREEQEQTDRLHQEVEDEMRREEVMRSANTAEMVRRGALMNNARLRAAHKAQLALPELPEPGRQSNLTRENVGAVNRAYEESLGEILPEAPARSMNANYAPVTPQVSEYDAEGVGSGGGRRRAPRFYPSRTGLAHY